MTSYRKFYWILDHETQFFELLGIFYFENGPATFSWTINIIFISSIFIWRQGEETYQFLNMGLQWRHRSHLWFLLRCLQLKNVQILNGCSFVKNWYFLMRFFLFVRQRYSLSNEPIKIGGKNIWLCPFKRGYQISAKPW